MFCQHCGNKLPNGVKFCPNCGAPVTINPFLPNSGQNTNQGMSSSIGRYNNTFQGTIYSSETKTKRGIGWVGAVIACVLLIIGMIASEVFPKNNTASSSNSAKNSDVASITESTNDSNKSKKTTLNADEKESVKEKEPRQSDGFVVSGNPKNMKIGEIGKNNEFYFGLACVRSLDYVQTAMTNYTKDVSSDEEVIYALVEVYNDSNQIERFNRDNLSIYRDSIKAPKPDVGIRVGVDGYNVLQSYEMDSETRALVVYACVVKRGWRELSIYVDDLCWKVTPEEVSSSPYEYSSLFNINLPDSATKEGSTIYSDEYKVIYDGFEIYTHHDEYFGDDQYAVFKFSINNTSNTVLDYGWAGHNMRGYQNLTLLENADYTMDDNIENYINVYDVDEIKPGMTAKVYVAFEITNPEGVFSCVYDTGFIDNEILGIVNAKVQP